MRGDLLMLFLSMIFLTNCCCCPWWYIRQLNDGFRLRHAGDTNVRTKFLTEIGIPFGNGKCFNSFSLFVPPYRVQCANHIGKHSFSGASY
uniref:Putative secreted protein n=1 Tax=Anopheles darlingi TaxID=43151 RepID=A0A2M4DDV7_ANODA